MTRLFLLALLMGIGYWAGGVHCARAQAAPEALRYYHEAAGHYVHQRMDEARAAVARGLALAPNHPRLQALQRQLEKKRPPKQQPQQGRSGPAQQSGGRANTSAAQGGAPQPPTEAGRGRQGAPRGSQARMAGERSSQRTSDTQDEGAARRAATGVADVDGTAAARMPLTAAEARRILNAMANAEQQLMRAVSQRASGASPPTKDW
ncbi:hypothetical protein [Salisaeta longa]|uniref:hypothetical protein n=1 Tax=Salisaeta longa TaxID=503170 RepID=UPI0003B59993|nr:hypothetical protein [Salisaeta longa]